MTIAQRLISEAASIFDTTERDILSHSKFMEHRLARNAVCYAARHFGEHLKTIGRDMAGRHHTTILSNSRWAVAHLKRDPTFAARVNLLLGSIK